MSTLTITLAGSPVSLLPGTVSWSEDITARGTLSFECYDSTGGNHISFGTPVVATDSSAGIVFTGAVTGDASETRLLPGPGAKIAVTCTDLRWYTDNHIFSGEEYVGWSAGDIIADILNTTLSDDGVIAPLVMSNEMGAEDFTAGYLQNTQATDAGLALAPAGSIVTFSEVTTADFSTGTLISAQATGNSLTFQTVAAMKLSGTCTTGPTNCFAYVQFWAGSQAVAAGDYFSYTIWVSGSNPQISGGIDFVASDGTTMRDTGCLDQEQLNAHPATVLAGYADNQWYYRQIPGLAGKTVTVATIAFESDTPGNYVLYVQNVALYASGGTLKRTFYNGTISAQSKLSNSGYRNIALATVQAAASSTAQRLSPGIDLSFAGMYQKSVFTFQESDPVLATTSQTPFVTVESSFDGGATWQAITNHQPLPGLLAGMTLTGVTLYLRETLFLQGVDPTLFPKLTGVSATLVPSYAQIKTDIRQTYLTSPDFSGGGTQSNLAFPTTPSVQLAGFFRKWDQVFPSTSDITAFSGALVALATGQRALNLRCGGGKDIRGRMDNAGSWTNFALEFDVLLVDSVGNYGCVYRTTGWQNANDTYAYTATLDVNGLEFGKGTNTGGGGGGYTSLGRYNRSFASNRWYRMKVVVNVHAHLLFIDNVQYLNITDATYTGSGQVALRHYNSSGSNHDSYFANFGITDESFTGNIVFTASDLSAATNAGSSVVFWNAATISTTGVQVEASLNGGSTYTACTNGGAIPGITSGMSLAGVFLTFRMTLTTQNASDTPSVSGFSWVVLEQTSVSGTRESLPLVLDPVGQCGSSGVSWEATLPTGTSLLVQTSLDGVTWDTIGSSGSAISGLPVLAAPTVDSYLVDTSSNYTSTHFFGGSNATWSENISTQLLTATGGATAQYLLNSPTPGDGTLIVDMTTSEKGGMSFHWQDDHNGYTVLIRDAQAATNPNTVTLLKTVAGATNPLGSSVAIVFPRTTYHRFAVTYAQGTITISMDGIQLLSQVDLTPLLTGSWGLSTDGGTAIFSQVWLAPAGVQTTGRILRTLVTFSTTDPTQSPLLSRLTTSIRGTTIASGEVLARTSYRYQSKLAAVFDDLATKSNYWWNCGKGTFFFQNRLAVPAPWILTATDVQIAGEVVKYMSPLYRNRQYVLGGAESTGLLPQSFVGDGFTTSWSLAYVVASVGSSTPAPVFVRNGVTKTAGVAGTDTGKDFYYTVGSVTISQDSSALPLEAGETLEVFFYGIKSVLVQGDDLVGQAEFAALTRGSGIVEAIETEDAMGSADATLLATVRLQVYSQFSRDFAFETLRSGLSAGQLLTIQFPEHSISNGSFLIKKVTTHATMRGDGSVYYRYQIETTEGPVVGSWSTFFLALGRTIPS